MGESEERARVVAAARGWVGTPYHAGAAVKGAGVDCARILLEVFAEAGLVERFTPEPYARDWHMHRSDEVYADTVARFAHEIPPVAPFLAGVVLLFRQGRTFSHGAIVTAWPFIVHAYADAGVVEEVDIIGTPLLTQGRAPRPIRAFDYWSG